MLNLALPLAAWEMSSSLCVPEAFAEFFFQRKLLNGDLLRERSFRFGVSSLLGTWKMNTNTHKQNNTLRMQQNAWKKNVTELL